MIDMAEMIDMADWKTAHNKVHGCVGGVLPSKKKLKETAEWALEDGGLDVSHAGELVDEFVEHHKAGWRYWDE